MGATSTDHGHPTARTLDLGTAECQRLLDRALQGTITAEEAESFRAQMLTEMARMSLDDGLVMQIHPGSFRNHNPGVFRAFGRDKGADIPTRTDYVGALKPLLDRFGNEVVIRRQVAHGIGVRRIARQQVRLAAAAAEVLFLAVAARARLLHPAGAAVAVEAFAVEPDDRAVRLFQAEIDPDALGLALGEQADIVHQLVKVVGDDGKPINKVKLGDEITVRVRVRGLENDVWNTAIVDLLPAGLRDCTRMMW